MGSEMCIRDRQQTYLHALIDNFPFRVWLKDTGGRYLAANRANLNGGAGDMNDVLGKTDHDLWPADIAERYRAEDQAVMGERRPSTVEVGKTGKTGSRWFEIYNAPVVEPDGAVLGVVGYARDITEHKTLETARESALHEAQRLARVRSEFVANMSHEIRTPLNAIIGLTHLIQRSATDSQSRERLSKVSGAAQHLLSVINDILDLSKIDAGKLSLEPIEFKLDRVLDEIAAQVGDKAEAKGLELVYDIAPALGQTLHGDSLRLRQILLNFVGNACLLYTSPSPRDGLLSRMPSSA